MSLSRGEVERERQRIPSRVCVVSTERDAGLEFTNRNIITPAKIKSSMVNPLSHPGALSLIIFNGYKKTWTINFFFFKIYFLRERERAQVGKGQKERRTVGSELTAVSPRQGLNSWTLRSWPKRKSDAPSTKPPKCPLNY